MPQVPNDAFDEFITRRKKDLQRIARRTSSEYQLADVVQEAWIMACGLPTANDEPLNLADTVCQDKLLSYLHQHLVRFTEQNVRRAIRLDPAPQEGDQDEDAHPPTYRLVSDEGHDPLSQLLAQEAALSLNADIHAHGSLAAAYVRPLQHFNNRMSVVADHLLISTSHTKLRSLIWK